MALVDNEGNQRTQVVICGGGPTGVMLSAMLGRMNVPNIVLERELEIVTDPRGIALDEDGIRCVQGIGKYDLLFSQIAHCQKTLFIEGSSSNLHKQPFLSNDLSTSNGHTGHPGLAFHKQPLLEKAIRDAAGESSCSELRLGCTVQSVSEDSDLVHVEYIDSQQQRRRLSARFLVGADGKTGYVRKKYLEPGGITLDRCEGKQYDETWAALNWRITPPTPETHPDFPLWKTGYTPEQVYDAFFPENFRFLCNPSRSSVCGRFGLKNDRLWRFEFVVHPHEDPQQMATFEASSRIIVPYLTHPGHGYGLRDPVRFPMDCIETLRSRPFHFQARSCNKWALGRVMVIGDAAHVLPPFGGQGIASGMRDASALAWRLCHLHRTPHANHQRLLESWYLERKQQLDHSLALTIRNGEFVTNKNPFQSFLRDWVLYAMQLEPHLKRWLIGGTRPTPKYEYRAGFPFLPEFGGGVCLPQVYARRIGLEALGEVEFTDDIIFEQEKQGLLQLLLLLDKVEDIEPALHDIQGITDHSGSLVLEDEATVLIQDLHTPPAAPGPFRDGHHIVARLASATEFASSEELCRGRPPPISYDAQRIRKDLRPGAKYVVLRQDRYVYAACIDIRELRDAVGRLSSTLGMQSSLLERSRL